MITRKQHRAIKAKQGQASADSKFLSHLFGSADIDAKGGGDYNVNFGTKTYSLITNEKIKRFETRFPKAKLHFIPKNKKLQVRGM